MAGCFGNSDYDRNEEFRLNQYLSKESDWDNYIESVIEVCYGIDPVLSDSSDFSIYCESEEFSEILNKNYNMLSDVEVANLILDGFIQQAK